MIDLVRNLPLVLAVIAVLVVLILAYIIRLIIRSARPVGEEGSEPEETAEEWAGNGDQPADGEPQPAVGAAASPAAARVVLRRSFRRAMDRIGRFVSGPGARYKIPFFLVLGTAGSRPPDLWEGAGISLPFGGPDDYSSDHDGCNWWFYDRGVVIDLGGNYVLRENDQPADPRGLRRFLELCQKYRPQRPLDGVVVTISCGELIAAHQRGSDGTIVLKERADQVYRALWQTQNQLGLRFPVYVLLTGFEELEGFAELSGAIPESVSREIFGWSSPYQLGTAYTSTWVDEALAELRQRLDEARLEILTESRDPAAANGVFALPAAVQALKEPLGRYLDQLLKPSAYHQEILFRGLYLCGIEDRPPQGPLPDAPRRVFFLADLLERKVFPEANLARPAGARLVATNRAVRRLQVALAVTVLVLGLGTWRATYKLDQNRVILQHFLVKAEDSRGDHEDALAKGEPFARAAFKERVGEAFRDLAQLDIDQFKSLFLPRSWLGGFEERLERGLGEVFHVTILRVMAQALEERAQDLAPSAQLVAYGGGTGFRAWPPETAAAPNTTEEFEAWRGFVLEIADLEHAADLYNEVGKTGDLEDFGEVVQYLTDETLPREFFTHSRLYSQAMREAGNSFDIQPHRAAAVQRCRQLATSFYRRITDDSPLAAVLARAEAELAEVAAAPWELERGTEAVEELAAAFAAAADALIRPEYEWAFRDSFSLGPAYDRALATVETTKLLGPEVAAELRRDGETAWILFRRRLMDYQSQYTGALIASRDDRPRMELSADVDLLRAALEDFLGQGFMTIDERRSLRPTPADSQLWWYVPGLEEALAAYQPYDRFRSRTLQMFPTGMRLALDTVARRRLGIQMTTLVAGAQVFKPVAGSANPRLLESQLRADVEGFVAAGAPLEGLMTFYRELGLGRELEELSEAVVEQGRDLLETIRNLLEQEQPWGGDFSRWNGDGDVSLAAFDKADGDELALYLELQRQRVGELATSYAQRPVGWLSKTGLGRHWLLLPSYSFWERVIIGLADYDNKKPGNSLAALETLIVTEMPEIDLAGCEQALEAAAATGSDYFRSRQRDLRQGLRRRCGELAGEIARRRYAELERLFNQRLAGRFPFAVAPGALVGEVEPDDLKAFFRLFDRSLALLRTLPEAPLGPIDPARPETAGDFVQAMAQVRAFFAHYLDADPPAAEPVFDLDVEFRVHRQPGDGSHEIIDWQLGVEGSKTMTQRDSERRARWSPGQRIRVALRWAKDSPRVPLAVVGRPGVSVEDGAVPLVFANRWSLLHLLTAHKSSASDFAVPAEVEPHTLKFEIETGSRPVEKDKGKGRKKAKDAEKLAGEGDDRGEVRVFIRVGLAAPESKVPLELPVFPYRAPLTP